MALLRNATEQRVVSARSTRTAMVARRLLGAVPPGFFPSLQCCLLSRLPPVTMMDEEAAATGAAARKPLLQVAAHELWAVLANGCVLAVGPDRSRGYIDLLVLHARGVDGHSDRTALVLRDTWAQVEAAIQWLQSSKAGGGAFQTPYHCCSCVASTLHVWSAHTSLLDMIMSRVHRSSHSRLRLRSQW